jgi:GxxExxY protein
VQKLFFEDESYEIRGAFFDVYYEMGNGFLEAVYQECLEIEFGLRGVPFVSQPVISLVYKTKELKKKYVPDFICYNSIVVEIKSVKKIVPEHEAQLINYLKASKLKLGFLVNFSAFPKVEIKRFVN